MSGVSSSSLSYRPITREKGDGRPLVCTHSPLPIFLLPQDGRSFNPHSLPVDLFLFSRPAQLLRSQQYTHPSVLRLQPT